MRLSTVSLLATATSLVAASPLLGRADPVVLTTTVYDNLKYYVQYSASAYCNSADAVGAAVSCEDGCPDVMANGATILGVLPNTTLFDLEGYVAVDDVRKEIVLAFRGSSDLRNWIADFIFIQVAYSFCDGCYVHDGFYESWNEVKATALDIIKSAYATYPDYSLVLAGHSLGAAVATLAAVELRTDGYPCDIYTVGSPRVGNLAFAEFVTAQAGAEYRATHYDDPVPRLPPIVLGFYHTTPEYWLEAGPATNTGYTIDEVEVCTGYANTTCNGGTTGLDGDAHEYYFQYMSCDDGVDNGVDLRRRGLARSSSSSPSSHAWTARDGSGDSISDEELAAKLTNYTYQDITFSKELAQNGTAQWP